MRNEAEVTRAMNQATQAHPVSLQQQLEPVADSFV